MSDYLILAAEYLGVEVDSIIDGNVYDDHIAVVVDKGIAGCPKYLIPLSALEPAAEDVSDLGIYDLSYRELQALAKKYDVQANQKQAALVAELSAIFGAEDEEE